MIDLVWQGPAPKCPKDGSTLVMKQATAREKGGANVTVECEKCGQRFRIVVPEANMPAPPRPVKK